MNNLTLTQSVIICTRNRPADIVRALRSIAQQTQMPDQLIIVDSSDVPLVQLSEFRESFSADHFALTQLEYLHSKPGLTYQRNRGIEHATGALVHFLDDDIELEPAYLQAMHQSFVENPEYVGGMGSVTNIAAQRKDFDWWLRRFFLLQRDYSSGFFTPSGMPMHAYGTTRFKSVHVLGGCCMAYRRAVLQECVFDEQLSGYCAMEDADMSWRVSRKYPLFFNPAARLAHFASPTARDRIEDTKAMFMRNYRYLFFKNVYPQHTLTLLAHWWSIVGLFLQAVRYRDRAALRGYYRGLRASHSPMQIPQAERKIKSITE